MSSRREQILTHIATTLAGTTQVGSRIYRSRAEAFARDEAPALIIEPAGDSPQPYSTCKLDWTLDVAVVAYVRGPIPDQLADPIVVDLHSRLMSDRTLGGLAIDILPGPVEYQRDKADLTSLWQVNPFRIRYRTPAGSLEVA